MTNNPSVQTKLRQHLLERLPQPITADSLSPSNVPYLEAVVHEALRLSRTAGGGAREGMFPTGFEADIQPKGIQSFSAMSFQRELR